MEDTILRVEGMTCQHCGERVASALRSVPGVLDVQMDWRKGRGQVRRLESVSVDALIKTVEGAAAGTQDRYSANFIKDGEGTKTSNGLGRPLAMLLVLPLCLLVCGGGAIAFPVILAFVGSKWLGVGPGLAIAAAVGLGTWWVLRRRQRACSSCLIKGSEAAKS